MKETIVLHITLFIFASVSVHLVSWVGSVLHSVPNAADSGYAVFTFRSKQDKPMTTNLLMNVMFPNVVLILFTLVCYKFGIQYRPEQLLYYVPYYYFYRLILICVLLRRKELCSFPYEFTNTVLGVVVAHLLVEYFLNDPSGLFIPVSEMVNEFWLIIFVLVYKFMALLMDKVFNQRTVVGDRRLVRYICTQFDRFFKKFEDVTYITKEDRIVWILLYSIMIYEDYNRVPLIRAIERLKTLLHQEATVGIMQVTSDQPLSDKESIIEAYRMLRNEIVEEDLDEYDEMQVKHYAYQYNPDEDYAESVAYIFVQLYKYINRHPKYDRLFNFHDYDDPEQCIEQQTSEQMTIDDLAQRTGLSKNAIYEKIVQEGMTIILLENEANEAFGISNKE